MTTLDTCRYAWIPFPGQPQPRFRFRIRLRFTLLLFALAVAATTNLAGAATININIPNFSFEADQVPAGSFALGNASWTSTGDFGRFHAGGDLGQDDSPTNGTQAAFLNSNGADAYQTLPDIFMGGNLYYFLSVDLTTRNRYDNSRSMVFSLYANGDPNNTVAAHPRGGSTVEHDNFLTYYLVATPNDILAKGAIGQTIGIRFRGTGLDGYFDIDNVRLEAGGVPEPTVLTFVLWTTVIAYLRRPARTTYPSRSGVSTEMLRPNANSNVAGSDPQMRHSQAHQAN